MTTKNLKVSKSVRWIFAMLLLTASKVFAEDDIPPIHNPIVWAEKLLDLCRDLWQLLTGFIG